MKTYKYNNRLVDLTCLMRRLMVFYLLFGFIFLQELIAQDKEPQVVITNYGLKPNDFLQEEVWNHRFNFTYFDGTPQEEKQLSEYRGKLLYFFFWDASYPDSFSDLRKLYEMSLMSTEEFVILIVHSKKSKDTLKQLKTMIERFEETYGDVMDAPIIMEDEFFTTLFDPSRLLHLALVLNDGMVQGSLHYKANF